VNELEPPADVFENRFEFETLLADLSSRFINLPPDEVDREIKDALGRICRLLDFDRALLWQWSIEAPGLVTPTHVYSAHEDMQLPGPIGQEDYPYHVQQMLAGRVVASSPDRLPAEATVDAENARLHGIKSNICLPLAVGGAPPVGALAFNVMREERDWPEALVKRLQLVAQVFANALARKRYEVSLRNSDAHGRATFEQAAVGIAHVGLDGRWLRVNDKLCAVVGYPREELLRMTFQDITHPDDLETDLEYVRRVLVGDINTYSMEKRYIRKDRSIVWIMLTVSLARTTDGKPQHFISVVEDITDRKRAEGALHISEARLSAAAELGGLGFVEVDEATGTVFADDRLRELLGFPPDRELGMQLVAFWMEHIHPDDVSRVLGEREEALDGKREELRVEYRYLHPVRGEMWLQHIGRPIAREATGFAARSFSVFRDITDSKRAVEDLRQSLAEIERLKDRLQAESDYLKAEISVVRPTGEVTGESPAIQRVRRLVAQVAPTNSSVLIQGETGTGKELVAQAIHRLSPRQHHVMVRVSCAALPSGLVESELFGRERGAFTGALTRLAGRFEVADGSTIFLDEIGELPADVQVKLLRVLQEGEIERLGSSRTIKVDLRVIAATNRDLDEEVRKGRFREDLYYRLNVFPIRVPPLRDRREDIPVLVWTFLEEFCSRMGKRITQIPRKTMNALESHSWPGNVRELRNVIEHAAIISAGDTLRIPVLVDSTSGLTLAHTLADIEREHIVKVLEGVGWRVKGPKGAAAVLGLNPSTLTSRMKKLGIKPRRQTENG
jgi:PAS domain S-box-containing protein